MRIPITIRRRSAPVALLLLLAGVPPTYGQSRVGTSAATFLTLGAGARGNALGHAYTASASGSDGLFWNPAGIAIGHPSTGRRGSVLVSHFEWFADVTFDAAGITVPVGSGAVGLSVLTLDYGDQQLRTIDFPEGTGETFGARDIAVGLSYAQPLTPSFSLGGTAKIVRQSIRDMSAGTVAFDLGFVLQTRYLNGLRVSAAIQNFGGRMQMGGINSEYYIDVAPETEFNSTAVPARLYMEKWDLPLSFKLGIALPVVRADQIEVDLLADSQQANDNDLNADLGIAARYVLRTLTLELRSGYKDAGLDNVDSHLSYGAGLDVRVGAMRVGFDFAYIPFDRLGDTRLFDLRLTY